MKIKINPLINVCKIIHFCTKSLKDEGYKNLLTKLISGRPQIRACGQDIQKIINKRRRPSIRDPRVCKVDDRREQCRVQVGVKESEKIYIYWGSGCEPWNNRTKEKDTPKPRNPQGVVLLG